MADTDPTSQQEPNDPTPPQETDPQGSSQEDTGDVDWEAKYNEMKAHSRKWEDLAKRNKDKADKFDEIENAKKTEAEKAAEAMERAAKAEAEKAAAEARLERMELVQKVAATKNVPPALLQGTTEEELEASAMALLEFAGSVPPQIPPDQGGAGKTPPISRDSLKDIKNPIERIKAREALNGLV